MPLKHLIILIVLILLLIMILLGTDVHSIVASWEHPLIKQINAILIQPIHDLLIGAVDRIVNLPVIVYIIMIAGMTLALFDRVLNKKLQQS